MRLSILDLVPGTCRQTLELARQAEGWGFHRFWLAEHHLIPGVGSTCPAVLTAAVASVTSRIRVGAGGMLFPNQTPLQVAEQFQTLEALFPGRIDLGVGRASAAHAEAVRRGLESTREGFRLDLQQLLAHPLDSPVVLLGSGTASAELANELGLPLAFAAHHAPHLVEEVVERYRGPELLLAVNAFAAPTEGQARALFSVVEQEFLRYAPQHAGALERFSAVGTPERVADRLLAISSAVRGAELILCSHIFDPTLRLRSFESIRARV